MCKSLSSSVHVVVPKCDHCSITQAVIYCLSDFAKLCLNCDLYIHSANPLSFKHTRSLICEKCCSRPSVIRCHEERISYCQDCHRKTNTCSALGHHVESLKPYSGCPSPTEFVKMWPSIFEPSVSSLVTPFVGSLPLNDHMPILINGLEGSIESSYSKGPQYMSYTQNLNNQLTILSKGSPDLKLEEGEEDLCEKINLENAPLDFDVGDDIIGGSPQEHISSPDCLFIDMANTSVTASNFTIDNPLEGLSPGKQECTSYQSGPLQININISNMD